MASWTGTAMARNRLAAYAIDPASAQGELRAELETAFHATMDAANIAAAWRKAHPDYEEAGVKAANLCIRNYSRLVVRWNVLSNRRRLELLCTFAERFATACGDTPVGSRWGGPSHHYTEDTALSIAAVAQNQLYAIRLLSPVTPGVCPIPAGPVEGATALMVQALLGAVPKHHSDLDWVRVWMVLALAAAVAGAPEL